MKKITVKDIGDAYMVFTQKQKIEQVLELLENGEDFITEWREEDTHFAELIIAKVLYNKVKEGSFKIASEEIR